MSFLTHFYSFHGFRWHKTLWVSGAGGGYQINKKGLSSFIPDGGCILIFWYICQGYGWGEYMKSYSTDWFSMVCEGEERSTVVFHARTKTEMESANDFPNTGMWSSYHNACFSKSKLAGTFKKSLRCYPIVFYPRGKLNRLFFPLHSWTEHYQRRSPKRSSFFL